MSININDFLWESLWDRKLIKLDVAWELLDSDPNSNSNAFGEPTIKLAIFDSGVITNSGVVTHPDLSGTVSGENGSFNKAYKVYNFSVDPVTFENDNPSDGSSVSAHGTNVAGIALANANFDGVVGSHPNARLIACQTPYDLGLSGRVSDAFKYLFGIARYTDGSSYLPLLEDAANILISSSGIGHIIPSSGVDPMGQALDKIIHRGRKGRGGVLFFAVGNEDQLLEFGNPGDDVFIGSYPQIFQIAASSLLIDKSSIHKNNTTGELEYDVIEKRAHYSRYGAVDFTGVSDSGSAEHNIPFVYETFTTDFQQSDIDSKSRNLIGFDAETYTLNAEIKGTTILFDHNTDSITTASIGDVILKVFDSSVFMAEQAIQIFDEEANHTETVRIKTINPSGNINTIEIYSGLLQNYTQGIVRLNKNYNHQLLVGLTTTAPTVGAVKMNFVAHPANPIPLDVSQLFTVDDWVYIAQKDGVTLIEEYLQVAQINPPGGILEFHTPIQSSFISGASFINIIPVHKISITDTSLIITGDRALIDYPNLSSDFKSDPSESVRVMEKLSNLGGNSNDLLVWEVLQNHTSGAKLLQG